MGRSNLLGRIIFVKTTYNDAGRLSQRGGILFVTCPSKTVPSGTTFPELRRIGSSSKALKESPSRFFEAFSVFMRASFTLLPDISVLIFDKEAVFEAEFAEDFETAPAVSAWSAFRTN